MSSTAFGRTSRLIALLLLLATVSTSVHWQQDGDACMPAGAERHDESKHVFAPVVEQAPHDHCAICHWQRVHRPAFIQLGVDIPALLAGAALFVSVDARPDQNSLQQLPARAPPATIL
jgi:hypothetical protein